MTAGREEVEVGGRRLVLSNLQRLLWPEAGLTKRDLVDYYSAVAPVLVPHLAGRPLTLWRFPQGVHRRGWWQNECRGRPEWLSTATIRGQRFCIVDDLPSLLWIVNLGTVELHPFLSLASAPEEPTAVVFDLDPGPPAGVLDAARVALRLRDVLRRAGLDGFPKTSGGLGLHVSVPLNTRHTYEETKTFARTVASSLADDLRGLVVARMQRSLRRGRVLVDWLQNDATRSTVAAYSLRARRRPAASVPVGWHELRQAVADRRADALAFTPADVRSRIERLGDPFRPVLELEQSLPRGPDELSPASAAGGS